MMTELAKLFEPGMIGKLGLKNRIVCAAMGTGLCHPEGYTTPQYTAFLVERAKGGAGLIITGVTRVVSEVGMRPGSMGIYHDKFIPGLKQMVEVIKSYDAKIFLQLHHPGTRGSEDATFATVAPSAIPHLRTRVVPKELSVKEIRHLVGDYGEAARRAKEAGFDGIEIHGGHGYLIGQFLSPRANKRKDDYGGNVVNRARFACEIIRRVRETVGPDFPIGFRVSGDEFVEGGATVHNTVEQAPLFVNAGADVLHVSAGSGEGLHWTTPNFMHPSGCLTHLAASIKGAVKVPVITVGKLGDPMIANQILAEGRADFIAMGRPLLADAELPNKARKGELQEIRRCIYCCNGCIHNRLEGRNRCAVNPALGQELEYRLQPAPVQKGIIVIGGGLAGMEAAWILAERGHEVSLYEKADKLGGQWNIAACVTPELSTLTEYLARRLQWAKVKVTLNKEVDAHHVQQIKPDVVVLATGASQKLIDIPGVHGKNVVMASDVLTGKVNVGQEVAVIGGRLVGLETAIHLAKQGKKVSVVSRGKIARDIGRLLKLTLKEELVKHGVYMYPDSLPESITERGLNMINEGEIIFLEANHIVIAVGSKSEDRLARELSELMPELEIRQIGDCVEPRDALAAIHEGFKVGNEV
jgi:2,4-dienoyl-CoA reductase-like NADH-dependent reductase (Old Yellow Enzyme family)/thioredoxin reductase